MQPSKVARLKLGGDVGAVMMALIMGVVVLFVGLFIIVIVSAMLPINNTSVFYTVYTSLITTVGTIFTASGLALIIAALGLGLRELKMSF